jgi:hypothetical protein
VATGRGTRGYELAPVDALRAPPATAWASAPVGCAVTITAATLKLTSRAFVSHRPRGRSNQLPQRGRDNRAGASVLGVSLVLVNERSKLPRLIPYFLQAQGVHPSIRTRFARPRFLLEMRRDEDDDDSAKREKG